jgi:hypothetical protein
MFDLEYLYQDIRGRAINHMKNVAYHQDQISDDTFVRSSKEIMTSFSNALGFTRNY